MRYYAVTEDPSELMHYGVPGMKWGVRKERRRNRSPAYKKAQSKLGRMMKSGIKKAEAHWKAYHSPEAKEKRFMDRATQKARTGTLKYGKLTDDQVRKITERLQLEQRARVLGNTENLSYGKRLRTAVKEGTIKGAEKGTTAYIEERLRGRGKTSADLAAEKRKAKYLADPKTQRRETKKKIREEYYQNTYEKKLLHLPHPTTRGKARNNAAMRKKSEESRRLTNRMNLYDEQFAKRQGTLDANRADKYYQYYSSYPSSVYTSPTMVAIPNQTTPSTQSKGLKSMKRGVRRKTGWRK